MPDTWTSAWAAEWAAGASRFNHVHAAAGSPTGGQFAASSGSSSKTAKTAKPAAAKPAAKGSGHAAQKAQLLAKAKADRAKAHELQGQLSALVKQQATAHAASV